MEVASSLATRGCKVTVVARDAVPFQKVLGAEIGKLFQAVHEGQGVKFKLGAAVAGFTGTDRVTAVTLKTGERIDADLVVVGAGVKPATGFLKGATLNTDGGVVVDEHMRAADGVYAAGDIACFPSSFTGERQRIEHWRTALQQGRIAAHNMCGKDVSYQGVPFFWTNQFDVGMVYVGHATKWDEIIYQGDVSAHDFLAFYMNGDRVLAVAGMDRDKEMAAIEELLRLDRMPTRGQLNDGSANFVELLKAVRNPPSEDSTVDS